MKTLLLIRHAHAGHGEPGTRDKLRSLSARGQREAAAVGKRLAAQGARPDLIVSSPAVRTCETARVIARALGYPLEDIVPIERLYEAEVEDLIEVIEGLNERHSQVILIAHNPALGELAWRFSDELESMVPGAVAQFTFDADSWTEVPRAKLSRASLETP